MRTEDLIVDLASRIEPVRPLPSPAVRAVAWLIVAAACAAVGMAAFGLRHGLGDLARSTEFLAIAFVAVAVVLFGSLAALVLAVPGAERSPALRVSTLALVALWFVLLVTAIVRGGQGFARIADWPVCFLRVLLISLVPAWLLVVMVRRAAPLSLAWTGALAAMAALSTGAAAIQFICPLADPGHALLGHFGPMIFLGGIGALMARRVLSHPRDIVGRVG